MSHIYTQTRVSSGTNLSALTIGSLSIAAIFALLPILMQLPNPFDKVPIAPPDEVAVIVPPAIVEDPPPVPEKPKDLLKPEVETPPPNVTIDQMAMLLNPSNNGIGVQVDVGTSFLDGDATNMDVFLVGQLDNPPRVLVASKPLYPYSMKGIKGEVTVEFIIDQVGHVLRPRVIKSSHREFEQAALDSVLRSKWLPGRKDGKDVRTLVHLPINFTP